MKKVQRPPSQWQQWFAAPMLPAPASSAEQQQPCRANHSSRVILPAYLNTRNLTLTVFSSQAPSSGSLAPLTIQRAPELLHPCLLIPLRPCETGGRASPALNSPRELAATGHELSVSASAVVKRD